MTSLNIQKVKDIKFQRTKNRKSLKQIFDFFLLNSINKIKKNLKHWILISDTSVASILITSVQSKLKKQSYTHHRSFCLQYPVFYLSLLFCLLLSLSITFLPLSTLLPFLHSCLMHFVKLSSSAFRAFIFLHLPFPLRDPFCPLISSSLLYLHFLSFSLLLILLRSPCVFTLVSSARPSYIPGMPATYGPHSSRFAERPTAPHRWRCRDQPNAERDTALLSLK